MNLQNILCCLLCCSLLMRNCVELDLLSVSVCVCVCVCQRPSVVFWWMARSHQNRCWWQLETEGREQCHLLHPPPVLSDFSPCVLLRTRLRSESVFACSCQTGPWHWPTTGSRGAAPPGLACTLTPLVKCVHVCVYMYVCPHLFAICNICVKVCFAVFMWQRSDVEKKHPIPRLYSLFLFLTHW